MKLLIVPDFVSATSGHDESNLDRFHHGNLRNFCTLPLRDSLEHDRKLKWVLVCVLVILYHVWVNVDKHKILLSFCSFSLLPNRHRPPCSTMPWDILPALVVLWGVCWMFDTPPHKSQSDQYNARPYTPTQIQEG
jgi:hypothetical protein